MRRRPTCDMPMPVTATWSSNLSAFFGIGTEIVDLRILRPGTDPSSVSPVGSNSGIHTSSSCSKQHLHLHAHEHVGRVAVDDVGGEADTVVLLDGDDGDHVGRREARHPGVLVDREARRPRPGPTPRPAPSRSSGSTGRRARAGGAAHRSSEQRWNRSVPSSPDFQKNSVLSLICGSMRPLDSATITPRFDGRRTYRRVAVLHYFRARAEPANRDDGGNAMPAQLKPTGGLQGCGVLVTGGGTGIGAACAAGRRGRRRCRHHLRAHRGVARGVGREDRARGRSTAGASATWSAT